MHPLVRSDRSIALVGLMGAGKTSIGRRLSLRLGVGFVDADDEIEKAAQRSISEIFARYGESEFRDLERRVMARLLSGPPQVIATGGGAYIDDATRALMRARCVTVWLKADIDTLAARVGRSDRRPLVRGKDPTEVLTALARVREPIYAEADLAIQSTAADHEITVDLIVDGLAALQRSSDRRDA